MVRIPSPAEGPTIGWWEGRPRISLLKGPPKVGGEGRLPTSGREDRPGWSGRRRSGNMASALCSGETRQKKNGASSTTCSDRRERLGAVPLGSRTGLDRVRLCPSAPRHEHAILYDVTPHGQFPRGRKYIRYHDPVPGPFGHEWSWQKDARPTT